MKANRSVTMMISKAASDRLDEFLMEKDMKRRRSCAVGDFAAQAAAASRSPYLHGHAMNGGGGGAIGGRVVRAHSNVGVPGGLVIPNSVTLNAFESS